MKKLLEHPAIIPDLVSRDIFTAGIIGIMGREKVSLYIAYLYAVQDCARSSSYEQLPFLNNAYQYLKNLYESKH
jgi:hypothetical protein